MGKNKNAARACAAACVWLLTSHLFICATPHLLVIRPPGLPIRVPSAAIKGRRRRLRTAHPLVGAAPRLLVVRPPSLPIHKSGGTVIWLGRRGGWARHEHLLRNQSRRATHLLVFAAPYLLLHGPTRLPIRVARGAIERLRNRLRWGWRRRRRGRRGWRRRGAALAGLQTTCYLFRDVP